MPGDHDFLALLGSDDQGKRFFASSLFVG